MLEQGSASSGSFWLNCTSSYGKKLAKMMEERSLSSLVPYSATDKLYIRAKVLIRFRPQDDEVGILCE